MYLSMEYENLQRESKKDIELLFYAYMNKQADKPKKEKPLEGDGRKSDKNDHKGDWGKHEPVRERPKDRDKKTVKPWKKR